MFKPIPFYIGLRYLRAKRRNHFISFIAMASMIGIALGVTVLITVLSVMNGFDQHIRERVFSLAHQASVFNVNGNFTGWAKLQHKITSIEDVVGTAPFINGQVMLSRYQEVQPSMLLGIDPDQETQVSSLKSHIISGFLDDLNKVPYSIVISRSTAERLNVGLNDSVVILTPRITTTPAGMLPRFKRFTIVAIFDVDKVGQGFGFSGLAYTHLHSAQTLFQMGHTVTAIRIKVKDLLAAPKVAARISQQLDPSFYVTDWTQDYGQYFDAVKLEKTMMFFILTLIIAVAAFNLVSSLVMIVTDKQADIAILRTLGATPYEILQVFMVQGTTIGFIGTLIGIAGGIFLSLHVTAVVNTIEKLFHVQLLSANVYFVDYLPSTIKSGDIITVTVIALIMSFAATLYPAWLAARTQPAEALRYE